MNFLNSKGFVVHRTKGITTLSSMHEPLVPARLRQAKEKSNTDTKADERGLIFFYFHLFIKLFFLSFLIFKIIIS